MVKRENLMSRIADYLSFRDIEFESDDFNRSFQVKGADRAFAFKFIDARLMHWLLSIKSIFGFEVSGPHLLVYSHKLRPNELIQLLGTAKEFVDRIPRMVWSEYGTVKQESGT
jgi:hypothetical protein